MLPFLTANWRDLIILNYEVNPSVLLPYVPPGTELDLWDGKAFASIVAFRFTDVFVLGVPVPFHRHFEEVNLRFYVKRTLGDETRRGVVFVQEFVPKACVALAANTLYGERYIALPMSSSVVAAEGSRAVTYRWESNAAKAKVTAFA